MKVTKLQGATLIEAIVSLSMLSLLMVLMFQVYRLGAAAWQSGEADVQLAQAAQLVTDRLTREVARSPFASVSLDPATPPATAIAFLSPMDPLDNIPDYDGPLRSAVWHSFSIVHHVAATKELRWRRLPLSTPTTTPTPLASLGLERNGGTLLAAEVTTCEFSLVDRTLELRLVMERQRYGKTDPDRMELRSSTCFRN